jgi:hypothetical protein
MTELKSVVSATDAAESVQTLIIYYNVTSPVWAKQHFFLRKPGHPLIPVPSSIPRVESGLSGGGCHRYRKQSEAYSAKAMEHEAMVWPGVLH